MRNARKILVILFAVNALASCETMSKIDGDTIAQTANKTVDGTVDALDSGTKLISDIDNETLQTVTKAPSVSDASNPVGDQNLKDATLSPLEDLNIRRREIPELLTRFDDPYAPLKDQSCTGYAAAISELDSVLGVDYDSPEIDLTSSDTFRDRAKDVTLAGINAGAGLFIPGRGIIKEATGAGPRERYLRALYQRGVARRGFLKGSARAKGCAVN